MTFYIVQKIAKLFSIAIADERVEINAHAIEMSGTSAEIKVGEIYTVEQLLYGLMLPSGNDAATTLADWGGGFLLRSQSKQPKPSEHKRVPKSKHKPANKQSSIQECLKERIKAFIAEMNATAKELGLKSTNYANQHGLSHSESKSTAADTARLCLECLRDEFFQRVVSTQLYKCKPMQASKFKNKREVVWKNTNKLLRRPDFMGIKTGITVTAGPCLASGYRFREKIYVCVVLRASKVSRRFKETRKLLAWSLEKLYKNTLTEAEEQKLLKLKRNNQELDSDHSDD
jgi:D-alanyl-D-alanine carboxypeptidase